VLDLHAGQQLDRAAGLGASPAALSALRFALAHLGDRYVWGGTGPTTWDCSGLVQAAYREAGISLPRVAADQAAVGHAVALADLLPGDLVFFATGKTQASVHHVAMYLGNGLVVHAPHAGAVVEVSPLWRSTTTRVPWQDPAVLPQRLRPADHQERSRHAKLDGTKVELTIGAAEAPNKTFSVTAFPPRMLIGSAHITPG